MPLPILPVAAVFVLLIGFAAVAIFKSGKSSNLLLPSPIPSVLPSSSPTASVKLDKVLSLASPIFRASPVPTPIVYKIDSVSPDNSVIGNAIVINGTGFSKTYGKVFLTNGSGETEVKIIYWKENQIQFVVPEVFKGDYKVLVQKASGERSNSVGFRVTVGKLKIDSASPDNVAPYNGDLTITGSDFGNTFGYVQFTDSAGNVLGGAMISAWGDTFVKIYNISVPSGSRDYFIRVVTGGRKSDLFLYHVGSN